MDAPTIAALVTAAATIALVYVTFVLTVATKRMAEATNQPHVVATVELNQWSVMHFDLLVANVGNGPAYDVTVSFDPPLPANDAFGNARATAPLQAISVLRPNQSLVSSIGEMPNVEEAEFAVTTTWKRRPNGRTETNEYKLKLAHFRGMSFIGDRSALVSLADEAKKMREALQRFGKS